MRWVVLWVVSIHVYGGFDGMPPLSIRTRTHVPYLAPYIHFLIIKQNYYDKQQESGDRDPSKMNITGGAQLLTRDAATGLYGVKEVRVYVCM